MLEYDDWQYSYDEFVEDFHRTFDQGCQHDGCMLNRVGMQGSYFVPELS